METLLDGCRHPDEVGALFEAYTRDLLRQAPDFAGYLARQDYNHELSHLEEKYGRPHGRLYLLRCDDVPAGTVALRRIDGWRCELKRLYVHPDFRGHGYARRLVETVLTDAAAMGYRQVLLDTFPFSSLRIKKQGEVKNFCRSHPAGPRRIGLAQSSGKSTLPTKE